MQLITAFRTKQTWHGCISNRDTSRSRPSGGCNLRLKRHTLHDNKAGWVAGVEVAQMPHHSAQAGR